MCTSLLQSPLSQSTKPLSSKKAACSVTEEKKLNQGDANSGTSEYFLKTSSKISIKSHFISVLNIPC